VKKDILTLAELSTLEAEAMIDLAIAMKKADRLTYREACPGYAAALIFEKPSTRTRVSLERALDGIGARGVVLNAQELQLSRGEDLADTARVLSRYVDAIVARVYAHESLVELARYATVPVVNALSDFAHPLQALADVMTILERRGALSGVKLAYLGDGNNVCHSLIMAAALFGFEMVAATPRSHQPRAEVVREAERIARNGFRFCWQENAREAVRGAHVVYTDTWVSMGQEAEKDERLKLFMPYQVNGSIMAEADSSAIFMHCLPAHKGLEVTEDVFESERSVVFDQAENRLHTAKAVFAYLWKGVRL
jgi:ornithine carbamoyltransferase